MIKFIAVLIVILCWVPQVFAANGELRVVYTYGVETLGQILNDFAKETGVKIHVEFRNQGDFKAGMLEMMEMNAAPDAIIMPADHAGMYRLLKYSAIDPHLFTAHIPDRIWASGMSDGTIYGAPITQGNHLVLFFNKSLVKEPAKTWDELFAQKQILEAKGVGTIAWSYDEPYWFLPFFGAFGGWPVVNGKIALNSPAMASALSFYKSLREKKLPYPNCSYEQSVDLFKAGKVAYTINGEWVSKTFAQSLGDNLGVSALPTVDNKKLLPTFSTYIVATPNNGLSGPKRADLIRFVNYIQSPKVQKRLWEEVGAIPVEASTFNTAQKNAQGYLKPMLALMSETRSLASDEATSFIWDAIGKGFIRYREGAMTAQESADFMQQLAERNVRNAQRQAVSEQAKP
jgi:ABC-type glycerol-3-phosphate transport system substrate-binding protein